MSDQTRLKFLFLCKYVQLIKVELYQTNFHFISWHWYALCEGVGLYKSMRLEEEGSRCQTSNGEWPCWSSLSTQTDHEVCMTSQGPGLLPRHMQGKLIWRAQCFGKFSKYYQILTCWMLFDRDWQGNTLPVVTSNFVGNRAALDAMANTLPFNSLSWNR